ncbi:uncharacterized protein [Paramormyrops kingsleyae]|uniref:uncharacterized protein isoform X1 n=1 Tax=Paramormyrops kingsleyae TaxID=1676925 RepID=UPI003B978EC3
MAQRMRIARAVSWTNDQYWGAWDLWDEVIDWGGKEGLEEYSPATPPTVQTGEVMGGLGGVTDWCKGGEGMSMKGSETLQSNYGLTSEEWEIYKTYYLQKKKKVRKNRSTQGIDEVKGAISGEKVELAEREKHVGVTSSVQVEAADLNVGINKMQNGSKGKQSEVGVNVKVVKVEGGIISLKAEDTKGNVKVEAVQVQVFLFPPHPLLFPFLCFYLHSRSKTFPAHCPWEKPPSVATAPVSLVPVPAPVHVLALQVPLHPQVPGLWYRRCPSPPYGPDSAPLPYHPGDAHSASRPQPCLPLGSIWPYWPPETQQGLVSQGQRPAFWGPADPLAQSCPLLPQISFCPKVLSHLCSPKAHFQLTL